MTDATDPDAVRVDFSGLQAWAAAMLVRAGAAAPAAYDGARLLVRTSLRGVDTHGIARLPQYIGNLKCGIYNTGAAPAVREVHGSLHCDGDAGLGQHVGMVALQAAMRRCASQAVVGCTIRNSGHMAALGVIVLEAAEGGFVAVLMQRTSPIMALEGFRGRAIGNNPLAFAMPVADGVPLVFDMAMSHVARGNVVAANREGRPAIPEGWAVDEEGTPTTDIAQALRGAMLPMAGHKGVGLAMLVECLAGSLTGAGGDETGAFLFVANPALLVGRQAFDAGVQQWLGSYRKSAGASGRYPGERQARSEAERTVHGIPLARGLHHELVALGQRLAVPFPEA